MKRNRKKSIPFFVLLFIHSALLAYTFYKKGDRKRLVVLLFSGIGLCFLFEYVILSLLKAYRYKPNILKNSDLDNFLGAILSQAIFVPFTAVFLTAFKIGWKGKMIAGLYFAGIEKLFILLNIHQNNWWKTRLTVVFLHFFFFITDFWYDQLKKGKPVFQLVSLFLMIMVNGLNVLFSMSVIRNFQFGLGRWHNWQEHFKIAPLYSISLSLFTAFIVHNDRSKRGVAGAFIFTKLMDIVVLKTGMAKKNFQHVLINNGIHILMIYLAIQMRNLIYSD